MSETTAPSTQALVDAVYRTQSRRVFATLIRLLGDFDVAEEALHDAFRAALEQWPRDVDACVAQAIGAGAIILMPIEDMFWGDRYCKLEDPFGHHWSVATHIRDVDPAELQKVMQKACA